MASRWISSPLSRLAFGLGLWCLHAQAAALQRLESAGLLTDAELDLVRRGRNRAGRGPRRGDAAAYGQATGFETMVGWLFLQNPSRLGQLLAHLEDADP